MIFNVEGIPRDHVIVAFAKEKVVKLGSVSAELLERSKAIPHTAALVATLIVESKQKLEETADDKQVLVVVSHENPSTQLHCPTTEAGLILFTLAREQHSTHLETEASQNIFGAHVQVWVAVI